MEDDNFYLEPEDSSAVDTFFAKDILSEKLFSSNNIQATAEVKSISELFHHTPHEDNKDLSDFDIQLINYLKTIRAEGREEAPKEFFTPYSNPNLLIPIFLLYLFLILVVRTGHDLYNY